VKKLTRNGAAERRAEYARLRLENVPSMDAAAAVGVHDPATRCRYEHHALAEHPAITPETPRRRPYYASNEAGSAS
jgi:hypothetical protein